MQVQSKISGDTFNICPTCHAWDRGKDFHFPSCGIPPVKVTTMKPVLTKARTINSVRKSRKGSGRNW